MYFFRGTNMTEKTKITIEFDNLEAAHHFAMWLCESGEQDYWNWMEYREDEEDGNITATEFNYHKIVDDTKEETDPERYAQFMSDNTIRTTCGRLDERR